MRFIIYTIILFFSMFGYSEQSKKPQPQKPGKANIGMGLTHQGLTHLELEIKNNNTLLRTQYSNQKYEEEEFFTSSADLGLLILEQNKSRMFIGGRVGYENHSKDSKYFNKEYLILSPVIGIITNKTDFAVEVLCELGRYFQINGAPRKDLVGMSTRGYNFNSLLTFGLIFNIGD